MKQDILRDGTKLINGMSIIGLSDLDIESIAFNLRVVDEKTWDTIVITDIISLDFS